MNTIQKLNGLVEISTDTQHILHRIGNKDYPEIRKIVTNNPDIWEEVIYNYQDIIDSQEKKLAEIETYDTSDAVNCFYLNGIPMWLDKATRVGLVNAIESTELLGGTSITFWYDTVSYTIPLQFARQLLATLEVYALECFNVTANHKKIVKSMTKDIENYDYTIGYPEKLQFNIND